MSESSAYAAPPDYFAAALGRSPVLAILRGLTPPRAVEAAEAAWAAGVELVEVSVSHDPALASVRAVCERARSLGRTAGAGTVTTAEQVRAVARAGCAFAVAPGLAAEPVAAAAELGLPYLPGIATPSEAQAALALGFGVVKLFPAAALGPDYLRALRGPFPALQAVAVGGIGPANAEEWLAAGAAGVGIGSGLDPATLPALLRLLSEARCARLARA